MHTFQFCSYFREAPEENTYLPKNTGTFPQNCKKLGCFSITKVRLETTSSRKKV